MSKAKQAAIEERIDRRRGYGWRKAGEVYLVAGVRMSRPMACGKLPIPLELCSTCGGGIRPARGWTWVNGTALAGLGHCDRPKCTTCPLAGGIGRCGLLWIAARHYPRPRHWLDEANAMGIAQRLRTIPRDLQMRKTWIMVAHPKAIVNADGSYSPAVFDMFRLRAIEYIVGDDDPPRKLAILAARGATLVRVHAIVDTPMFGPMDVRTAPTVPAGSQGTEARP